MFQNAAIDIAVGLTLMYLMLSLPCTVINEFIATRQNLRSKSLAAGLEELLDDPVVRNGFYDHGLIAGTTNLVARGDQVSLLSAAPSASSAPRQPDAPPAAVKHPSYLSADTFVLALLGSLTGTRLAQGEQAPKFADVQTAIQNLPPSRVKGALLASLMTAGEDFEAFRMSVATWFDDSMDRLSGAYKRHMKLISIIVGCAVAVLINADTFDVGSALWKDGGLRSQMVQAADVAASGVVRPSNDQTKTRDPTDIASAFKRANETLRPLPIGWPPCTATTANGPSESVSTRHSDCPTETLGWTEFAIFKVVGWLATGLALSFGAPFWFDMLSKVINIRGSGVKPDRQDQK
jgi:hypothetical protein